MSVEVVLDTPLAQALNSVIQPKLVDVGWSTGGTENDLAEYIILMLVNGKTQEQIAAELSGDLLNLEEDNPDARNFSRWLFEQVDLLNDQPNSVEQNGRTPGESDMAQPDATNGVEDADMGDAAENGQANVPTGPKSMRDGRPRDRRMLGHLAKAMDRTSDSVLHKVRSHSGTERINSHSRAPPTGPRQQTRSGPRNSNGSRNGSMPGSGMMYNQHNQHNQQNPFNLTPQAQMEMLANLEQQMQGMAQMMQMSNGMGNGIGQQQPRRSLADRIQPNPNAQQNGFRRGGKPGDYGNSHHSHP